MKKIFFLLLLVSSVVANAQTDHKKMAAQLLDELAQKKYALVYSRFDSAMKAGLDTVKLKKMWEGLLMQVGSLKKVTSVSISSAGSSDIVDQLCTFDKTDLLFRLSIDKKDRVGGMFLLPPPPQEQYKEPVYAKTQEITERGITVKTGEYSLPGYLTLPKDGKKLPLVILIQGSGPNDMDESIGPNKPFKDIALGLASNGIAVLRYNKRTHDYGAKMMDHMNELTVKEEIIDDAMSALQLAKTFPEIDTGKIFFLGHSEGAMMMPRIADGRKDIAGIIMMAGNARPLEDLILEQTTYLLGLDGFTSEDKSALMTVKMQVMEVKRPTLSDTVSASRLPLGCPAKYWMDLKNYHQVEVAEKLKLPMFILQGERDYQVTMEDYKLWQQRLERKKNVTLHSYPKLNHLFQEGDAPKSTPQEYDHQVNVPEYVIKDIADFIKKH